MISKKEIKNTGATFTPKELADFLADRILNYINKDTCRVLDPACGEGELLFSISEKLSFEKIDFQLTGYDTSKQYIDFTKKRLESFTNNNAELICQDFLESESVNYNPLDLFYETTEVLNEKFDIVIANPPYVRTQLLGTDKAQFFAKKYNLKGRVDLYYPFLISMTESLKEGGIIGVITSNRYLSTKSGDSVRKYLSNNYEILELIDLGDTKLFDAAVLPAIFIGKKTKKKDTKVAKFIKLYEEQNSDNKKTIECNSVYDILRSEQCGTYKVNQKYFNKTIGSLKYEENSSSSWRMFSNDENEWVSHIENNAKFRIKDFFKVKVGIKSTADKIFISDKWDELNENKPESELLKDLISQENIEAWSAINDPKLKVLYPHLSINGKKQIVDLDNYPKTQKYFEQHQEQLKSRKYLIDAGRNWFELWVPHQPEAWEKPKLVFPDISINPRFYFDTEGKIVNGNCYWIVANKKEEVDLLMLIQGIANSKLMSKYHDLVFNNKLYSGRRRYFSQYVEKYPLPDPSSHVAREIISIVRNINESGNDTELLKALEVNVAKAFGLEIANLNLD